MLPKGAIRLENNGFMSLHFTTKSIAPVTMTRFYKTFASAYNQCISKQPQSSTGLVSATQNVKGVKKNHH